MAFQGRESDVRGDRRNREELGAGSGEFCSKTDHVVSQIVNSPSFDMREDRRRVRMRDRHPRHASATGAARGDRPVIDDRRAYTEPADKADMPGKPRRLAGRCCAHYDQRSLQSASLSSPFLEVTGTTFQDAVTVPPPAQGDRVVTKRK